MSDHHPAPPLTSAKYYFLLYGPKDAYDDAFADESAVLAAWATHRSQLLAHYPSGRRPWAFRALDHPKLPWRGFDRERSGLWRAGDVLTEAERVELETWWRQEFARAMALPDDEARRKHLAWADVPHELRRQWSRERRRKESPPI
jgi:hypothetical protein